MLPAGYVSVVLCDTRRAEQWRRALVAEGIEAVVEETETDEAHLGACRVAVPRADLLRANAFVTAVTKTQRTLGGWMPAVIVVGVAGAIVALVWLAQ